AGIVLGLVVEAAVTTVALAWLAATSTPIPWGSTVVSGLALTPIATGLAAGLGVGIGAAIPNQLGAVLVSIGWVMLVEQLIGGLLPMVGEWLPFAGAGLAITGDHPHMGI